MPTLPGGSAAIVEAHRWPARSILKDGRQPLEHSVCATIRPIRSLDSFENWFDELDTWTEGFQASTSQRARIQSFALEHAFGILDGKDSGPIAVTLSFGTVERHLDHLAGALEGHARHSDRLLAILRGSFDRLRSRYRLRAFVEYLHMLKIPVGYLLTAPRFSTELKTLGFLQPDFAKVPAPTLPHIEPWQDLALEARVAGVPFERLIVTGVDTPEQLSLARQVGIPFGQGSAVVPAHPPLAQEGVEAAPVAAAAPMALRQPAVEGRAQEGRRSMTSRWVDVVRLWNADEARDTGEGPADEEGGTPPAA